MDIMFYDKGDDSMASHGGTHGDGDIDAIIEAAVSNDYVVAIGLWHVEDKSLIEEFRSKMNQCDRRLDLLVEGVDDNGVYRFTMAGDVVTVKYLPLRYNRHHHDCAEAKYRAQSVANGTVFGHLISATTCPTCAKVAEETGRALKSVCPPSTLQAPIEYCCGNIYSEIFEF